MILFVFYCIIIVFVSALSTTGTPDSSRSLYAVQSNEVPLTIRCPFEPGSLQNCYFGEWRRGSTRIVSVERPRISDCEPGSVVIGGDPGKYRFDRESFSLIITSLDANTDSGEYECRLSVLDPASPIGATIDFRLNTLSLTVDGKCFLTELTTVSVMP